MLRGRKMILNHQHNKNERKLRLFDGEDRLLNTCLLRKITYLRKERIAEELSWSEESKENAKKRVTDRTWLHSGLQDKFMCQTHEIHFIYIKHYIYKPLVIYNFYMYKHFFKKALLNELVHYSM